MDEDDFVGRYRLMASTGDNFHGLSIVQYAETIRLLVLKHKAASLLDYGSGRGDAYKPPHALHRKWGTSRPRLYDPAFDHLAVLPETVYDGVLCSDVLEHIPESSVDETVAVLFAHARKFVWASVCCRPAKKTFPDGVNLHVTVRPFEWWRERFASTGSEVPFYLHETK